MSKLPDASGKLPSEFELIARLSKGIRLSRRTILGIGDDCAIVSRPRGDTLFTIDSMVENVHFDPRWGTPEQLGARALEVNLSDIAAMGGRPTACVVNLAVRDGISARTLDGIYAGLRNAAREASTDIVGGNITRARELSITIALLGEIRRGVMRRDAARPGDQIFVTGTLGDAALGWRILAGKLKPRGDARRDRGARKYLVERFLSPQARLFAGERLAALRPAPAAIDVSDGLMQDLGHILERSGVGAEIEASRIPVSPAYRAVMGNSLVHALTGGEDYELIFCARRGHSEAELSRRLRVAVRRIGTIVRGKRLKMIGASTPTIGGWDQLRSRG
ncbi:MAG TPA: thiamine-phosphate kinase [Candidatus Binatus sp.]|uniref:thiamine-phosphate kinase n=1 Tax=Candidatus Binatus sp. TaxID=2811406 RepID=UPI002B4610ED|nr:thiamine-phosphate kinase [Candidatus Binatus sp.]HKN13502.1 thiamine-phosphate kinase [Candidatus Binatus sp.]